MQNPLANFLLVLTFFTRLPLPHELGKRIGHDARMTEAVVYFPVVGFIIGIVTAIVWYLSSLLLAGSIAAGLAIMTGLIVTGALHEDGFADCADGLGGSPNREKALEIMRDSRIGTYGGLALIITVGLRWLALATLSPLAGVAALLIAHATSRSAMTLAMKLSQYARPEGLGKLASGDVSDVSFLIAILLAFGVGGTFGGFAGLMAVTGALGFSWAFLKYLEARIGGYTGDGLGAMQQVAEITTMIILVGAFG